MFSKKVKIDHIDENFIDYLEELTESDEAEKVEKLIIGYWGDISGGEVCSDDIVDYLIENKDRFPKLKSIFWGDTESEECEMTWMEHCDMSPLIMAFPDLKSFKIKGSIDLSFENLEHSNLEELEIISGGLPDFILKEIESAKLPKLKTLNLYLGCEEFGFSGNIENVLPFMKKELYPNIKHLALKNCEIQDEVVEKILDSSILDYLETLDLSMGCMTDKGADLLLKSKKIKNLKILNIKDNCISLKKLAEFKKLGIEVIRGRQKEDHGDYYISISE